jgi:hypothetical protein
MRARSRTQRGAVAVMVAVMALLLFGVAALSVDLGNAWSRKRAVQKQVDISAISAGYLLPMTTANASAIADQVATFLNKDDNRAFNQGTVTGAQLRDGNANNGEVYFQNADGSTCTNNCLQMQVVSPPAKVDFGLASAIGFGSQIVSRAATVRLRSGLPKSTLPFWLPSGCGYGAAQADTTNGNNNPPTPTPTPTPTAAPTGFTPGNGETDNQLKLDGPALTTVNQGGTVTMSGLRITGLGNNQNATLRIWSPDGTIYKDYAAISGVVPDFQVGTEVSTVAGDWWVYALGVPQNGNGVSKYSSGSVATPSLPHLVVRVQPAVTPSPTPTPTSLPVGCQGPDRGNFGQLDSPRKDEPQHQQAFALNIALGLDHSLIPFAWNGVTPVKDCGTTQHGFIAGAQPDTTSIDNRNCVIADTGNDGPYVYQGLVTGPKSGVAGRLDARVHPTNPQCGRADLPSSSWSGVPLNNDVLSCFLRNGAHLSDIASQTGVNTNMLDQSIQNSPRFVELPVVVATDRGQKNFQPISYFVPAFITDESLTSSATNANGLDVNGNSVETLHVFVFSPDAIEADYKGPDAEFDPNLGPGVPRLVQ